MLGDFIGRGLFMILGYAYPAFECFKTVERNNADIHQLRFWCQYWIIVAVLSVCERFGDIFISWLPLYGEIKLAFIIYLWYPKTKGTSYVYESILRPLVSRHETDIDKHLQELRFRAWDLAIYYYQNCSDLGQSAFFNVIQYIANQSTRLQGRSIQNQGEQGSPPPPSSTSRISPLRQRKPKPESPAASPQHLNRRWPPPIVEQPAPSAPPMPATFPTLFKEQAHPSKSKVVQVEVDEVHTEYVHVDQLFQHEEATKEKRHSSSRLNFLRVNKT
ncbi:putative HVA22-like protein g [Silene latifolia]|uniref:putative HVA22-like protein g n=1 Tax=Silene latifolia TaxID=37657 RepID=UPI003D781483